MKPISVRQCSCFRNWFFRLCCFHPDAVYYFRAFKPCSWILCSTLSSCFHKYKCKCTHEKKHTLSPEALSCSSILMLARFSLNRAQSGPEWTSVWAGSVLPHTRTNTGSDCRLLHDGELQPRSVILSAKRIQIIDRNPERCWKNYCALKRLRKQSGGKIAQMALGYNMLGRGRNSWIN